jgi:hypothetical protein
VPPPPPPPPPPLLLLLLTELIERDDKLKVRLEVELNLFRYVEWGVVSLLVLCW